MFASPWIHNAEHPDTFNLPRLLAHPRFAGKKGEDLAVAIWKYTVDPLVGFYHFWSPSDREFEHEGLSCDYVKDPLKLINSYGQFLCGTVATVYINLCETAGLRARQVGVTGHSISEVYYDGAWHLMDCDLRAYHRVRDGSRRIASLKELLDDPTLVSDPVEKSDPFYLPDRSPEGAAKGCFAPKFGDWLPPYLCRFHSMDYLLRPGERFTRYPGPKGHWNFPKEWLQSAERFKKEWNGDGPRERFPPHRTYANGVFLYKPDLTAASRDLELGAWSIENGGATREGFRALDPARPARADFLLHTPWVIVGVPSDPKDPSKKFGAAKVDLEVAIPSGQPGAVALKLSLDGQDWVEIARITQSGTLSADLTEELDRRHRALLRLETAGAATVRSFACETWVQMALNAYPYLSQGETVFRYHGLDENGRRTLTEPWIAKLECPASEFGKVFVSSTNLVRGATAQTRLSPADPAQPWSAVFRIEPQVLRPRRILAARVWASIQSLEGDPNNPPSGYPGNAPKAKLEAAASPDGPWTVIAETPLPLHAKAWHWAIDGLYRPASGNGQGVPAIYARVTSPSPGWEVRASLTCVLPEPPPAPAELEIVHQWKADGQMREHRQAIADPARSAEYRVAAQGKEIEDVAVTFAAPSVKK